MLAIISAVCIGTITEHINRHTIEQLDFHAVFFTAFHPGLYLVFCVDQFGYTVIVVILPSPFQNPGFEIILPLTIHFLHHPSNLDCK